MSERYVSEIVALVPVRGRGSGKTRLADVLSPRRRDALVETMLSRVLQALAGARHVSRIVVVTPDADFPLPPGVERLRDSAQGLNEAVLLGMQSFSGSAAAVLMVAADAPQVTALEIDRLIERARDVDVAVVPDRRGSGSNALWVRLPTRFTPRFGTDSARQHLAEAARLGLSHLSLPVAGLSHDVDVAEDLDAELMPDALARALADEQDLGSLMRRAEQLTLQGFGQRVGYSRKVFIPLTHWCRDVCHYCTFAAPPKRGARAFLSIEEVLTIARQGAAAGCDEALFTLGDKPELRYPAAREQLAELGFATTLDYLAYCASRVWRETGLMPHLNPGVMQHDELARLRSVSVSMGLMLESSATRLGEKGGPHHRSPDKDPGLRLATLEAAGELQVPFTSGLLLGIGETRAERIETLLALRASHLRHGHLQEVIVQNFRAKPGTRMANAPEPSLEELQWTIAVTRLIFGKSMSIQAPPNLSPQALPALISAGVNDWGGVSPVTPDHVNPEAPWPELVALERQTRAAGRWLVQRLPIIPSFAVQGERWLDPAMRTSVLRRIDATGYALERDWVSGAGTLPPVRYRRVSTRGAQPDLLREIDHCIAGHTPDETRLARWFAADGADYAAIIQRADELRRAAVGDVVTYVVNRNINYTNICSYRCGFCAFAKGRGAASLRGPGYRLDLDEIARRVAEASERGATEVCLQGGIHPSFTGETYLEILRVALAAAPEIHVHAFSPLEVAHGARSLGLSVAAFLEKLAAAGLRSLPGTAAEILSDDVRAKICPDKLTSSEWLEVMQCAHEQGLRSTATIMFGHVDTPLHWARHLLALRSLQEKTRGFTEFVPLPFVHMEAPIWRQGQARSGPSWRETMLMHALGRIVLAPVFSHVQCSWVKLGRDAAVRALGAGVDDLGGVLMNESITRAAGGRNGQELGESTLVSLIHAAGRKARERTTLYGEPGLPATDLDWLGAGCLGETRPPVSAVWGSRADR